MTIVLIALVNKIADQVEDRWILGSGVVLAANAGGVFSPVAMSFHYALDRRQLFR